MKKIPSWQFGDTKKEADMILRLVISGKKTATSSFYDSYNSRKQLLPKVGDKSIVKDSKNNPRCLIINTKVTIKPFKKIGVRHAFKEGEGDRSIAYWRITHRRFFKKRLRKMKKRFNEGILVVCEEFKVLKIF